VGRTSEPTVPIIERLRIQTMSHKCEESQFRNGIRTCNLVSGEVEVAFQAHQILLLQHNFNPSEAQHLQHPLSNLLTLDRGQSISVQPPSIPQHPAAQATAMTRKLLTPDCSDLSVPPTLPLSCHLPPRTVRPQLPLGPHSLYGGNRCG
jgi:hypothetical protein